jgi:hypothetical protein
MLPAPGRELEKDAKRGSKSKIGVDKGPTL